MNQSTNYNFNLPEGTDLVNLLTQLIPNWSNLDTLLKGVENQAFTNCTEVTTLGVHAISRTNADGKILKWIATSNFTAGETFTVDGNVVAASTPAGATLATGAYVTGSVIIAALNSDESAMTIFVSGTNVATDSERLGGELPSYYATASDMGNAQNAITDLDNLMGTTSISAIGDGTVTGAISKLSGDLTKSIVASQSGLGTKTASVDLSTKASITCVVKKGSSIIQSVEIPAACIALNDVIHLGSQIPLEGTTPTAGYSGSTVQATLEDKKLGFFRDNIGNAILYDSSTGGTPLLQNYSIGLGIDLTETAGASVTYTSSNTFTLNVSDSSLTLMLLA